MTSAPTAFAAELGRIPVSARRAALQEAVTAEFRTALLMTPDEALPADANYFELGLTSLRVTEIKQNLEEKLGCEVDAAVLFASPTVADLTDNLVAALPGLFPPVAAPPPGPPAADRKPLVDSLLKDLFEA
ncbi:acyl carrier protein [Couchioplanes caeruleus]|uniref:acyl carrier protein n=1 Tax=Couchioplanes caeruleus TaxID=56438 RepID=UPI0020BE06E1|nr:acyl carrier protein [Couchioplanes caeruleus]UQU63851.1 acyl carrier protein [Couchioplanes caeruleus]